MHIERVDAWSAELDELLAGASGATFYHTGAWLRSLGDAYPRMSLRLLTARDGGTLLALLPYFESRRGPLRTLWSLPFGTYGGPVGEARAKDELWREQFDKPRRRRVRRAEELGVTVRRGSGERDMAGFMQVYRERLQGWKSNGGHPETLFFALIEHGGDSVRLYVAEHEGVIVGGHLNFYYKDAVIAWYGMTSARAGDTQAGTLLYSVCMREACEAGFRTYNLGASLGKRSLIEYKESLGGAPHSYRMLRRRRLGRVAALVRRASRPA